MRYQISEIANTFPDWYDPKSDLSRDDQKWIWENLPLSELNTLQTKSTDNTNDNVINDSVNGTCKLDINTFQISEKLEAISSLKHCNYKTAPKVIASYLETVFEKHKSKEGHWLYIAQTYTPKTITSVIDFILKQQSRGEKTIVNSAAYFTSIIKYRKKRRTYLNSGIKQKKGKL